MLTCNKCGASKDEGAFELRSDTKRRRSSCKDCDRARKQADYRKNPAKRRAQQEAWCRSNHERKLELARECYYRNRDKHLARNAAYYWANVEKKKAVHASYYKANREKLLAACATWSKANLDKGRINQTKRRALERGAAGSFTEAEWGLIVANQRGRCAHCQRKTRLTIDHIVPLSRGGTNFAYNIQGLCGPCNFSKQDTLMAYAHPSLFDRREAS